MRRRRRERGVALLVVLAASVCLLASAAMVAQAAATATLRRTLDRERACAADLLHQGERLAIQELERRGASLVLPPQAPSAALVLCAGRWRTPAKPGEAAIELSLSVTAWDECGRLSAQAAREHPALAACLPESVRRVLDRRERALGPLEGLDQLPSADLWRFPSIDPFCEAAGSAISTHGGNRLNVSTAPTKLLAAVLRAKGRGGLEAILEARAQGKVPSIAAEAVADREGLPALTAQSEAFGCAIRAQVGSSVLRQWSVLVQQGSWRCVQRLEVCDGTP